MRQMQGAAVEKNISWKHGRGNVFAIATGDVLLSVFKETVGTPSSKSTVIHTVLWSDKQSFYSQVFKYMDVQTELSMRLLIATIVDLQFGLWFFCSVNIATLTHGGYSMVKLPLHFQVNVSWRHKCTSPLITCIWGPYNISTLCVIICFSWEWEGQECGENCLSLCDSVA